MNQVEITVVVNGREVYSLNVTTVASVHDLLKIATDQVLAIDNADKKQRANLREE